jgi:pimeloyl-ACP methyl ester carboxylesterase
VRGRRRRWLGLAVAAVVAALGTSASAEAQTPQLQLPPPSGPHRVGEHSRFLIDRTRIQPETGRPRAIPIRIWYPAAKTKRGRAPRYMSPLVQPLWEQVLQLPPGSLSVDVDATQNGPYLRRKSGRISIRGVILQLPGYLSDGSFQTNQAIELASRGYVVITTDHPGTGYAVQQPGGRVVQATASENAELVGFSERLRDVRLILHRLHKILPRRVAAEPKAILGHSMGGAVSAASVFRFRQLRAGMDYDGSPLGDVVAFGLSKPFGLLLASDHFALINQGQDPFTSTFLAAMRGPHPIHVLDVLHWAFTDWAVLSPELGASNPELSSELAQVVPTGTETSVAAGQATVVQVRRIIIRFLRRYLRRP